MSTTNPWGIDENKYFTDVGGIQDFLTFHDQLQSKD